jgi:thioredoxin 1
MKKCLIPMAAVLLLLLYSCSSGASGTRFKFGSKGTVIHLTDATFKEKVFNYEINQQWKYEGSKPAIVDFYASWCKPCLEMSPILDEMAKEYKGKIIIYKVDISAEELLAKNMRVKRLPMLLFIPVNGNPKIVTEALPKDLLVKAVEEVLLVD